MHEGKRAFSCQDCKQTFQTKIAANKHDIRICKYFTNQAVKPTRITCLYTSNGNILWNINNSCQDTFNEEFHKYSIVDKGRRGWGATVVRQLSPARYLVTGLPLSLHLDPLITPLPCHPPYTHMLLFTPILWFIVTHAPLSHQHMLPSPLPLICAVSFNI